MYKWPKVASALCDDTRIVNDYNNDDIDSLTLFLAKLETKCRFVVFQNDIDGQFNEGLSILTNNCLINRTTRVTIPGYRQVKWDKQ
jgi:hypothetical protein